MEYESVDVLFEGEFIEITDCATASLILADDNVFECNMPLWMWADTMDGEDVTHGAVGARIRSLLSN